MNRRITLFSAVLLLALVLGFQLGMPRNTEAVAFATSAGLAPAPVVASATNQMSIDTTPYWNGSDFVHFFGVPNTATYGQTISMTKDATLIRFSFFMELSPTMVFRGYVFGWDGLKATGTPLFQSAPMSTTHDTSFEEVVFTIPAGIGLNAGQQYVLFASTSTISQTDAAGRWGFVDNVYREGQFVFLNNGTDSSKWTSTTWSTNVRDLAFKATFAEAVVTPTTLTITEPTGSGVFTVSLTSQPTATVTLNLTSSDPTECTVPASVDLTAATWQTGMPVTVSAVDDLTADDSQVCTVQLTAASSDSRYQAIAIDNVAVTVTDNDSAGVVVTPTMLTIAEPTGSGIFAISLTSQPTATVTLPLTSTRECSVPTSVNISPLQWQTGITVTVSGAVTSHNGPQLCQVELLPIISSDTHYLGLNPADVSVTVINDYGLFLPLILKTVR